MLTFTHMTEGLEPINYDEAVQELVYTDPASLAVGKFLIDLVLLPVRLIRTVRDMKNATPEGDEFIRAANIPVETSEEASQFEYYANQ